MISIGASILIAAVALLLAQVILVAGVAALRPKGNIYFAIVAVSLLTAPLAFFADHLLFGRSLTLDGRMYLVLVHLALGGFLFHFMTLPDRSVTMRILVELLLAPGHVLTVEELQKRYSVRSMIESRLDQLSAGAIIEISSAGVITLKPRGLYFGRFVTGGRRLFRITSAN